MEVKSPHPNFKFCHSVAPKSKEFTMTSEIQNEACKNQLFSRIQMIWCASFTEKNRRYDLEVMNNGEAEVSVFENNILEKRLRLQTAPDKWDIDVAKSLNLIS